MSVAQQCNVIIAFLIENGTQWARIALILGEKILAKDKPS
jgi:hypothetical protein